jgi:hypothetical protein
MDALIEKLLTFRNIFKVFHWRTTSYPRHVASDAFVTQFDALVDRFMEVYIGRYGRNNDNQIVIEIPAGVVGEIDDVLFGLRHVLGDIVPSGNGTPSTDLQNIRDEMLALVNQTIYLFSLND